MICLGACGLTPRGDQARLTSLMRPKPDPAVDEIERLDRLIEEENRVIVPPPAVAYLGGPVQDGPGGIV
jgi:hypothetical protein